ncbi:MAG: 2-C-methyl-D-erythritol 4-phosphate cytidylyltransferase [Sphingobacteriia bacterium]|nr:MAG: 2-C-methyl-D-erythritol 4-phosphate cytidylyltransferase [Sphingobacteriia bacterium]
MKKIALITAGGKGNRMGTEIPKQFLLLNHKPVLWHTLTAFLKADQHFTFILVVPADFIDSATELINEMKIADKVTITSGGETRFHSVKNGLDHVKEPSIVFVHDAVRCLIQPDLINRCFEQAIQKGSAIPAVASTDSVRIEMEDGNMPFDRSKLRLVQTPQTFKSDLILPAFQQVYQDSFTDEATVVEAMGNVVHLIEGDYQNIKITRPMDMFIAQKILEERN